MQYNHKESIKTAELEARKDSISRQRSTIKGQISETIAPWSMTVVNSVKELNFLQILQLVWIFLHHWLLRHRY